MLNNNSPFPLNKNIIYRKSKINGKMTEKKDKNINKNIGPYSIIAKINEGNNSKIYIAKSKYTNDEVIVKIIEKEIIQENLEDLTLVLKQIESLKILKHKNIISLYEIYESPKYFYLIMEYCPKKNLIEKIILKKRLNENEALIIFIQLLDALIYMHKMNIAHRNLRTEHILFDKNNRPKIIGFNYSTFYQKEKKIDGMFGSLCYICPEILNEEQYNPELADVWSLGAILYVMICGYLPFSEENDEKNKNNIIEGKVEYPKEISNKIKDLLKHMLDVNDNKRYNFQKVLKHPWVKQFAENKNMFIGGINIIEIKYPVDERILNIIEQYFKNFDKKEIKKDLIENKYNEGTGLYKLLLTKIIGMKLNSISDLFSNSFIKYIQNKNNYFNNGDKNENCNNYNKYLDKINNRINKLENYIDDYKKREDETVKYLLNLENLKNSINKNNNNIIKKNLNNDLHNMNKNNLDLKNESKNNIINEDPTDGELDEDIIKKFKEQQNKQKIENENIIINKESLTNSLLYKKYSKAKSQNNNSNNINNLNNNNANNNINNNVDSMKSITPDSQKIINQILVPKEKENKINESLLYSLKKKPTFQINSRKSHIDRGSLLDGYLKKNHPENIRKTLLRFSLFSNISEEEDDDKNNNKKTNESIKEEEDNNKENEENTKKKLKELKYSLSFMDDGDEGESEFNESSYISRNDTRFNREIQDVLKELNDMKKKERENKTKENNNKESIKISPKKSNFKNNLLKLREKNVNFSNKEGKNQNFIKENVNHFIINNKEKIEEKNKEGNNFIILEGADFSFHEEGMDENLIKSVKKLSVVKIKNSNICEYKNDKNTISKLDNITNKENIFINNIEKIRKNFFLFSFSFDKLNIKKINIDNIKSNENTIEKNLEIYSNKINNNEISNNINIDKENGKKNNIMKYNESILNKSNNNLQSEQLINSSNNSIISNNKNSSIINSNNNNFLYDNNFLMNNDLNEVDDSIYKIIEKNKDSNRDTSFDISSIHNLNKKYINEKIFPRIYDNELKNKTKIKNQNLTDYKRKRKNLNFSNIKYVNLYNKKSHPSIHHKKKGVDLSLSEKNKRKNKNSFIYDKKRMRNKSLDYNTKKNYFYINKSKNSQNKKRSKFFEKSADSKLRNNTKHNTNKNLNLDIKRNQKTLKQLEKEFLYIPNLNDNNHYKTLNHFNPIKNNNSINLYKKKHARYSRSKEKNKKDKNETCMKANTNKKFKKKTYIKNIPSLQDKNIDKKNNNKNIKTENKLDKEKKYGMLKTIKTSNLNNQTDNKTNSKSLNLLNHFKNNQNKVKTLNKNKPKLEQNKSYIENKNIIHEKVKINKKTNKNLENMLSKRKEMIKKIRNCKKYLNNLNSDKKFYTVNHTKENINYSLSENPSKTHKIILSDNNALNDKINNPINDSNKIKINNSDNKQNFQNLPPQNVKMFDLNFDSNQNIKNKINTLNISMNKNNNYESNDKNLYININNSSVNSSSISHDNYNDKLNNIKKKYVSNDTTNNKITYYSNSSNKGCSNDTSLNFEDISLILGKSKKVNFAIDKNKK